MAENYSDEDYRRLHRAHCHTGDKLVAAEAENARLRDLLVRTRAVLNAALGDEAADLDKPERANVLRRSIDEISTLLAAPIVYALPPSVEAELAAYEARSIERSRGLDMLGWIHAVDTWDEGWPEDRKRVEIVKAMADKVPA